MSPADRVALVAIAECVVKVRTYVQQAGDAWTRNDMAIDARTTASRSEDRQQHLDPRGLVPSPGQLRTPSHTVRPSKYAPSLTGICNNETSGGTPTPRPLRLSRTDRETSYGVRGPYVLPYGGAPHLFDSG